jgi:hypothetical protein
VTREQAFVRRACTDGNDAMASHVERSGTPKHSVRAGMHHAKRGDTRASREEMHMDTTTLLIIILIVLLLGGGWYGRGRWY